MRILCVSHLLPLDLRTDVQGPYKRMGLFIDALKEIANLDVLFFVPRDLDISSNTIAQHEFNLSQHWNAKVKLFLCPQFTDQRSVSKLQKQGEGVFDFFKQSYFAGTSDFVQVQAFKECLARKPDAIFVQRLQSMCPIMLVSHSLPPIFFDLDDIEHVKFIRQIRQPPSRMRTLLYGLQVPARLWGELKAIRLATLTFVCSELDRHYLSSRWKLSGITTIPNAVSIPEARPVPPEPVLLFLGAYHRLSPNVNAANFLIEEVFPYVLQSVPEAKLLIAGKDPHYIRSYHTKPQNVEFIGFVDDLDTLYYSTRVVCCPILSGGGTRTKMIEAAAYGKSIVATKIGAEGLDMLDGQDFLLRDQPKEFAQACVELLKNDSLCKQLGTSARSTAIRHYDRSNVTRLIQQQITSVIALK